MQFRKDINGLRALAVLAVIFFHFNVPGFAGGFVGVDVFFVISGFLMTAIILSGNKHPEFSILGFYASRTRRILPALTALCFLLLVGGYFWLAPSDYTLLGKHASSSVSFLSNFIYKGEEGYFDAPSRDKWLLHTWSLSVEWQFYMLYPLLISAILKYQKKKEAIMKILLVLGGISLLFSAFISPLKPEFSFYLLPTRMWEMIAGALIYLLPAYKGRQARLLEALGLLMIAGSIFLFSEESAWPGYLALLPVIGTVLVLRAARQDSFIISNPASQSTGVWSYSIYLWHWPIIVGLGYFGFTQDAFLTTAGIAGSFFLGWLSYKFIEHPFRHKGAKNMRIILLAALVTILLGLYVTYTKGLPARVDEAVIRIDKEAQNRHKFDQKCGFDKDDLTLKPCVTGDGKNIRAAVWGDSHASTMISPLQKASGGNIAAYTANCVTIFNTRIQSKERNNPCPVFNDLAFADIQKLPSSVPVVIVNRFSYYIHGANEGIHKQIKLEYAGIKSSENTEALFSEKLTDTLCKVAATRKTYVLHPVPEMGRDVPKNNHPPPDDGPKGGRYQRFHC
jgi:peptidoglycan/LPS O-acetylase OafA/YrhL